MHGSTDPHSGLPVRALSPLQLRDELARLLHAALLVTRPPHAAPNPIAAKNEAERILEEALSEAGASYREPTPEALREAAQALRRQAPWDGAEGWQNVDRLLAQSS